MRQVKITVIAGLLVGALASGGAAAEWVVNADAGVRHDDNLANAEFAPDVVADTIATATVGGDYLTVMESGDVLTVGGRASSERYDKFTGLNNVAVEANIGFRSKWGLGAYVPWSAVTLSSTRLDFGDAQRDGWRHRIAISAGQRISDRWRVEAELAGERRTARDNPELVPGISGNAFAQRDHSLALSAEYAWRADSLLTFGYLMRRGDVVATTLPGFKIFGVSKAISLDPVFGPNVFAYSLPSTTYGFNAGLSYAITVHTVLGFNVARQVTHAEGGNNYSKSVQELTLGYTF
jgi:hypothetical protein